MNSNKNRKATSTPVGAGRFLTGSLLAAAMMAGGFAFSASAATAPAGAVKAQAAANTASGIVTDQAGEPLAGVSVMVQGTKTGVATNIDGRFSLSAPAGSTLTFSYVGCKPQSVVFSGSPITVVLEEDASKLDEVVVVGYGTVRRRDLTGAVASMKNSDVVVSPTNNVMEALQGKVAGMDITKGSGETGSGVNILLRGSRSIYGDNTPLFIIDGVPGSYNQVNPNDIESIDVLKDASSTAIYGSAGANGVVIITTKRGSAGKAVVNFDAYYGFSGKANFAHGMTGDEWTAYQREAYKYKNGSYPADNAALLSNPAYLEAYEAGKWIDWVDLSSGKRATTEKYALSVSGGNENTRVFASTSYSREEGLLPNDKLDKYALRLNIDQVINPWATIGFTSNLTYSDHDRANKNTFSKSLSAFPLGDAFNEDGSYRHEFINGQYSPMGDFIEDQFTNNTRSTYINSLGYLEIKPFKGLNFRSQINTTLANSRQGEYWGKECNANQPTYATAPYAQKTENNTWAYTWENILGYTADIADHTFGIQGITSYTKNTFENTQAGSGGFISDAWQFHRLLSGSSAIRAYSDFSQTQKMSYAARVNYSYKGRYLLTFSNRWDGVSWFSASRKWDAFPAGALAWRISEEEFMAPTRQWLDNLKLRVSYGVTGNSGGTGAYVTQSQVYYYPAAGVTVGDKYVPFSQYTGTYASQDLGWEKSYNWNIGLDFAVLNNRIDGSVEYFDTQTKGLLFKRTLPITNGVTGWGSPLSSWQNLARTANKGVELTVNSRNIVTRDFTWTTTLTATWSKEMIKSLPDGDLIKENLFEGQPIKSLYGYKYDGLWTSADDAELMKTLGVQPGFIKVETVEKFDAEGNGDGGIHKYGDDDRQILGHSNPNWILGLNNSFTYRDFDFSVFMMGRFGQTISSSILGHYTAQNSITTNQLAGADYWTEQNENAYFPRPGSYDSQSKYYSCLSVVDGSFMKIKNVTLGYTMPRKLTRKALVEKLRVYATAYNPWIIVNDAKLKGTDPETGGADAFPTYKQFVFGVNITL